MRFDGFNDLLALNAVSVLEETLKDAAAVVLEDKLLVFGSDQLQTLVHDGMLLIVCDFHLTLLDKQLIVVDLYNTRELHIKGSLL